MAKCSVCGREISETQSIVYDNKCKKCYNSGESYEIEEGLLLLEGLES